MMTQTLIKWFLLICAVAMTGLVNVGQSQAIDITAESCSDADIQSASDQVEASGGGTVYIPAGNCTHTSVLKLSDGVNFIGAGEQATVITGADMKINTRFYGRLEKGFRISGITFLDNSHITLDSVKEFRIDHVTIEYSSGSGISVADSHSGVIDHCTIKGAANAYYGLAVTGGKKDTYEDDWKPLSVILGKSTAIFIEDNLFTSYGHAIVGHGNAHYVARYNTFENGSSHAVDAHGPGYGPPCGTRLVEVYNNIFNESPEHRWKAIGIRGGAAFIFNNTFNGYDNGILFTINGEDPRMYVQDSYVWDNLYINLGKGHEENCPGDWTVNNVHCNEIFVDMNGAESVYNEGDEFFLRASSMDSDDFTYSPYIYPHPLVSGSASPDETPEEIPDPTPAEDSTPSGSSGCFITNLVESS